MSSEIIHTAQAISQNQRRFTFISSAAQQDPGTGSICIDSHFDSSYSLICLLIHSLIHFIWLPGQQSSSKFTHRSLLDGCFAHPWYKWVYKLLRCKDCLFYLTGLGVGDIPVKMEFVNPYTFFLNSLFFYVDMPMFFSDRLLLNLRLQSKLNVLR